MCRPVLTDPTARHLLEAIAHGDLDAAPILADRLEELGDARAGKVRRDRPWPPHPDFNKVIPLDLFREIPVETLRPLTRVNLRFVPPCDTRGGIVTVCDCGKTEEAVWFEGGHIIDKRPYRHVLMRPRLFTREGDRPAETLWIGICQCGRCYWSWDGWPRPEDKQKGHAEYAHRILTLFPEGPRWWVRNAYLTPRQQGVVDDIAGEGGHLTPCEAVEVAARVTSISGYPSRVTGPHYPA